MILEFDYLGSTQDEARTRVRAGERHVVGVRAGCQTAGRGRHGARWEAPFGTCLLVTYILRGDDCRPESAGRLAFVAAVAVADAIAAGTGLAPNVKWPNDILLSGRKVAGILIETVSPDVEAGITEAAALIGIGLNVNIVEFPPELSPFATSLQREAGRTFSIEALEMAVRKLLFAVREETSRQGFAMLLDRWRERDVTQGTRFRAPVEGEDVEGVAVGIDDRGALLLRLDMGRTVAVFSACSVRPAL